AHDPDGQGVDSDPYGLVALSPTHQVVADAAGNDLLDVNGGNVSLITTFPDIMPGVQPVPTSVVVGPDGAYYVGEFGGDGAPAGVAVSPSGEVYVSNWSIAKNRTGAHSMFMGANGQVVKLTPAS